MLKSIRWKITFSYVILYLLTLILLGLLLFGILDSFFRQNMAENLKEQTTIVANSAEGLFNEQNAAALDDLAKDLGGKLPARITFIASDGVVWGDSDHDPQQMENHLARPEIQQALREGSGTALRNSTTLKRQMFYLALPVKKNGRLLGFARLSLPFTRVQQALGELNNYVTSMMLLTGIFLALIGLRLASLLTRPLENIGSAAKEIAKGNYDRRITYHAADEIGQLADAMNHMADSIQSTIVELSDQKRKLETVLNTMANGVLVFNSKLELLIINPAAREFFGVQGEKVLNKPVYYLWREDIISRTLYEVLKKGEPVAREFTLERPQPRTLSAYFAPIIQQGSAVQIIVIMADITNIRRMEEMRRQFVANVSHELRTPLTSIAGFVETLLDGALEDRGTALRFLGIIQSETQRLHRLIDDLLDLSLIEGQKEDFKREPLVLKEIIDQVAQKMEKQFAEKGQKFTNDIPEKLLILGNHDRMAQVFVNLLSNSIKYTQQGGRISISAKKEVTVVEITVADTGIGIPEADKARIFERFYRVDKARSRQLGGTGLGLAIVKHIVESHGGKIWLESRLGQGTKFMFTVPQAKMHNSPD